MQRICASCGCEYEAKRPSSKFCSTKCRQRAYRRPKTGEVARIEPDPPRDAVNGPLSMSTVAELEAAGRLGSAAGQAALAVARRVDAGQAETGSSLAALVREHRAALAAAVTDAKPAADPLDELRLRCERKLHAG